MFKTKVTGKTNVIRNIAKASRLISGRSNRGVEKIAEVCESFMQQYVPKKTGYLSNTISVWNVSKFSYAKHSYLIVSTAPYSAWISFGRTCPVREFLPYGKTGGRDYSKSRYTGSQYMQKAFTEIYQSGLTIFKREFSR